MNEQGFLALVKKHGHYGSKGEANRAAHAVFGTIKGWLSPTASNEIRQALTRDASQLWQYAPVAFGGGLREVSGSGETTIRSAHFILKVQQLGKYRSSVEARRATCSVFSAVARSLKEDPGRSLGQVFPPEIMGACRVSNSWAA